MTIYIILLFFLVVFSLFSWKKANENVYIIFWFLSAFIFFLPAFRDINVGTDTYNYVSYFLNPQLGYNKEQEIEISYQVFSDIIRIIWDNYNFFLFVISVFSIGAVLFFIKKNSTYVIFSLFLFCASGVTSPMYFLYFSGMRQIIAIAFFLLAIHYYIKDEKKWFLIFSLYVLSVSFHISALVFFPVFFLHLISISKKLAISLIIASYFLGSVLANYASSFSIMVDFVSYEILGFASKGGYLEQVATVSYLENMNMIMLPFSLLCILFYWYQKEKYGKSSILLNIFFIGVFLNNLLVSAPMMFRIVIYCTILIIVVLPAFLRDKSVPIKIRYFVLYACIMYFAYKYYATLADMVIRGFDNGDIIVPYNTYL